MRTSTEHAGPNPGSPARKLPTSADVARAAGVSRSTVSFVLNDTAGARIPKATRERVVAAAADLGYVANRAAADLRRGASNIVLAVLDGGRADSVALQYLPEFSDALRRAGLTMVTTVVSSVVGAVEVHEWASLRPMALVAFGARFQPAARKTIASTGCVLIGDHDADVLMGADQAAVAVAGVAAMHERGKVRLVQVLPREASRAELAADRVEAFRVAAGESGQGTVRMALDARAAATLVGELLARPTPPDGIVTFNDEYASEILAALLDAGVAVPDQVAVLGSDNSLWGARMRPALSTLTLQSGRVADQLVEVLEGIAGRRPHPDRLVFDSSPVAVHRQTT